MKINKKYMGGGLNKKPATYNGGGVIGFIDDLLFGGDDDSGSSSGSGSGSGSDGAGSRAHRFEGAQPASTVFRPRKYDTTGAQQDVISSVASAIYEDGGVPLKKKTIPQVGSEMPREEAAEETRRSTDEAAEEQGYDRTRTERFDDMEEQLKMYLVNIVDFSKQYPDQFEQVIAKFAMEMGNELNPRNTPTDDIPYDPLQQKERRPRFIE
tara:strand:+ start:1073 stop:1702 length:630 start_codon:yes stop_codon:yes gene_type:complete